MSDMHRFILQEGTEELLSPQIIERVKKGKNRLKNDNIYDMHSGEIRDAVQNMIEHGYFTKAPNEHRKCMERIFKKPEHATWTIADSSGTYKERMEPHDILLVGGIIAADIVTPDEFWNDVPGFSGASDVQSTIGALMLNNRDLFFESGGYSWESVYEGARYRSLITGSTHGDLRIERIRMSYAPTTDPYGHPTRCKPITSRDRQLVSASYSCETTLLAGVLKYIDQEKIDVPCLSDGGKALLSEAIGKSQHIRSCADFGDRRHDARSLFIPYACPMNQANADRSIFFDLPMQDRGSYSMHIDERRHLAFSMLSREGELGEKPSLTFPPEEMEHVVQGIFTQAQQCLGRTSVQQLSGVLAYRYSDEFEQNMRELRSSLFS